MTRKYLSIRDELFEANLSKCFNANRSLKEMKSAFKPLYIILLGVLISTGILLIVISIVNANQAKYFAVPPFCFAFLLFLIPDKKLYYEEEYKKEKEDYHKVYKEYLKETALILGNHIYTKENFEKLKQECVRIINEQKVRREKVIKRISDIAIFGPVITLVTFIISGDSLNIINGILSVILVGILMILLYKIFGIASKYLYRRNRDEYLYKAINEIEYSQEAIAIIEGKDEQ